jgi:hypothetical protein
MIHPLSKDADFADKAGAAIPWFVSFGEMARREGNFTV